MQAPPAKVNRVSLGTRFPAPAEMPEPSQAVTWDSLQCGQPETPDACKAERGACLSLVAYLPQCLALEMGLVTEALE